MVALGQNDSSLIQIKHYLVLTGDWASNDRTPIFTDSLLQALKNFQYRMGIKETGKITPETIIELNKPIELRIKQMMVNNMEWNVCDGFLFSSKNSIFLSIFLPLNYTFLKQENPFGVPMS